MLRADLSWMELNNLLPRSHFTLIAFKTRCSSTDAPADVNPGGTSGLSSTEGMLSLILIFYTDYYDTILQLLGGKNVGAFPSQRDGYCREKGRSLRKGVQPPHCPLHLSVGSSHLWGVFLHLVWAEPRSQMLFWQEQLEDKSKSICVVTELHLEYGEVFALK